MYSNFRGIRKAKKFIRYLYDNSHKVLVIHYSCESLSDNNDGYSPRITSIVVRTLRGDMEKSFSIHLVAEIEKIDRNLIEQHYDRLEFKMLSSFVEFAKKNSGRYWINWNMRNANYGFEAIWHRYEVLGGKEVAEIPYENRVNISAIISEVYGREFEQNPKMKNLIQTNFGEFPEGMLTGEQEVEAFKQKEFVKLHTSTIVKTNIFCKIIYKLRYGKLKVKNTGLWVRVETFLNHPLFLVIALSASIISILAFFLK